MQTGIVNKPPIDWKMLAAAVLIGILIGVGLFTFDYAEGGSYFSEDPNACINCHVMREQFDRWNRSSHHAVATCNDCHTPHVFPDKWIVKGINGWNHSLAFTTGLFPSNIRIRPFNTAVVEANCVACHRVMVGNVHRSADDEALSCVSCHGNVGHER